MDRFWRKVDKSDQSGCWVWKACLMNGYGAFSIGAGKWRYAHRISWKIANGEIPGELCVLHHCDNRSCVNPSHLFLGTRTDNMIDKVKKGRARGGGLKGESNPKAKLHSSQILAIRADTCSQRETAAKYGVTRAAICDVKRRKSWAHIS